ncbi:hypothetical protein GCM10010449_52520 [Streptomyces rectiviolaceus]|uniref:Uncharacterized protein n=1 Tax=Streptomyces rectiviolaceus TaxID=332591 RepID=A0ABP6MTD4_9ACTN
MSSGESATAAQAGHVCPACKKPVAAEVTRHKTMGIFVPLWKSGPCHNPSCPNYVQGQKTPTSEGAKP